MGSSAKITAPGAASREYVLGSSNGNKCWEGIGRNEPYNAFSRFPLGVHMGSCTVTKKTLFASEL